MSRRTAAFVAAGLAVALVLAVAVSRAASTEPDGLERVAADLALDAGERPHPLADGPLSDDAVRGVGADDEGAATAVAGAVGVAATFALAGGLAAVAARARRRQP